MSLRYLLRSEVTLITFLLQKEFDDKPLTVCFFVMNFGVVFPLCRHQIQTSANEKVLATKKDLQRLTVVVRHGDKQQKLQVERLTSDFQKVVEIYSACQQVSEKLMEIHLNQ